MATANLAERAELDKMIWSELASRGAQPSVEENKCRSRFCTGEGGFYEYSALVDVKLSTIPYEGARRSLPAMNGRLRESGFG